MLPAAAYTVCWVARAAVHVLQRPCSSGRVSQADLFSAWLLRHAHVKASFLIRRLRQPRHTGLPSYAGKVQADAAAAAGVEVFVYSTAESINKRTNVNP